MFDFHTHFIPKQVLTWLQDHKETVHAKWEKILPDKHEFLTVNGKWGFELKPTFYDLSLYNQECLDVGVTHSVLSPIPQLFMYDFSPEITTEVSQIYNSSLAEIVDHSPDRFSALGTVPLTAPKRAATILNEAMKQGLKGAIIGPGLEDKLLSNDFFAPLFEEANRLKAILFIHPLLSTDPRIKAKKMPNLIGVPWETTVTATDIILSGLIDKYPDVKIIFAHGGGFLPYQLGRMDKGYDQWKDVSSNLKAAPSEYAKRFWYDTVLWDPNSLDLLIKTVGEDRVVPGSDFPFDLSVWPPKVNSEKGSQSLLGLIKMNS
ncbi:amidohydrolase family protein [Oceanobacillus caeni]|uniref:Amidohydrolase n=1 Tax=Oceanobacillus caeni TaxID=405946 RepID=A0ABR5MIQ6_9BACI|nr:amidohydrolase family protein [Oceanobacillus caeni]KPH74385.1 amidohydrolase [Oceanobacillus caeni]